MAAHDHEHGHDHDDLAGHDHGAGGHATFQIEDAATACQLAPANVV